MPPAVSQDVHYQEAGIGKSLQHKMWVCQALPLLPNQTLAIQAEHLKVIYFKKHMCLKVNFKGRGRNKGEILFSLVYLPDGHIGQVCAMPNQYPRASSGSFTQLAETQGGNWPSSSALPRPLVGAESKLEQTGHQPVSEGDAGIAGSKLT